MWTLVLVCFGLVVGWKLHKMRKEGEPLVAIAMANVAARKHACPLCGATVENKKFFTMQLFKCPKCHSFYNESNIHLIQKGVCSICKSNRTRSKVTSFQHDPNESRYKVGFECGRVVIIDPQTQKKEVISRCPYDRGTPPPVFTTPTSSTMVVSSPAEKKSSGGEKFVVPCPNILQYYKMLEDHDWSYMMSDDGTVCSRGYKAEAYLKSLWKYDPRFEALYQEFSKYVWNDTQKAEKPTLVDLT
jgi:hypothetical protein